MIKILTFFTLLFSDFTCSFQVWQDVYLTSHGTTSEGGKCEEAGMENY